MSQFWAQSANKNNPQYKRMRLLVLARDQYICQIRNSNVCTYNATVVDHVVPVTRENMCDPLNMRASCKQCNSAKAGQDRKARNGGGPNPTHRARTW
jgi:5-methylcytosine-specific restriction endonuclease McrA